MSRFCFFGGLFHKDERKENLKTVEKKHCRPFLLLRNLPESAKVSDKIGNRNSLLFQRRFESFDPPPKKSMIFDIAFPKAITFISNIPPTPPQIRNSPKWDRDSSLTRLNDQNKTQHTGFIIFPKKVRILWLPSPPKKYDIWFDIAFPKATKLSATFLPPHPKFATAPSGPETPH